ncbi:MAG: serine/threonine protein kinase [Myxacorys californica WJT36-NPBG1]|jgi:serine/threonine-protein kinase|nr:serine/threonine protein kinase [Myxacorys californica WJT36-NPBG1]
MQPAISVGTILQNRYRILNILGHGGFGRTYLAEDQGRFNELCALKELTPPQDNPYALNKSKELFQREAQILYQIEHPQIPQFRATFEEDQRLFLVQDYVEGKTYQTLLDERKHQGFVFSENEVLQLVKQVLPVLAYIHGKGIIHRDIAPDNVILRDRDQLPVLIDFGVVKEIATRMQGPETFKQQTTVGKLGYAPSEQMQTGRAYPNSDLYALAVTALVLLTGRDPQELFDENTMTWQWQRYVNVNPTFAQVLNRMLSYRVGDRFQSANEVMQMLQTPGTPAPYPPSIAPPPVAPPPSAVRPAQPDMSQMATQAIGRRSTPTATPTEFGNRAQPTVPTRSSMWDDPWAVFAIGTGLVLLVGLGAWAITRGILTANQPSPTPTTTISPSPRPSTPSPRPSTPSPSPSAEPVTYSQTLDLAQGSASRDGTLRANQTLNLIVPAQEGQELSASVQGEEVLMTVLAPDDQPVDAQASRTPRWSGTLPYTGKYVIQLKPVKGLQKGAYKLNVELASPPPPPSPSPTTPPPTTNPTVQTERISFPPGQKGTQVTGKASPTLIQRYILNAREGQLATVRISQGATLVVRYPDGRVENTGGAVWQQNLSASGDYEIDVIANQDTNFTLDVNVQ